MVTRRRRGVADQSDNLRDACFECLAERLAHGLELDPVEHVLEEAAHDEPLRLLARETACHCVEELLAVDLAQCRPVRAAHVVGEDLEARDRVRVGRLREQLFYLMARGLPRAEAERLIVRGFFQDVLDRIELEPVREALGEALEARIPQA